MADEPFAGTEGLDKRFGVGAFEVDFNPGADGVMIGGQSVSPEMEGDETIRLRLIISEEAEPAKNYKHVSTFQQ